MMPDVGSGLKDLIMKYPVLSSALMGASTGAPLGAALSEEGVTGRGAVQGALLGAGAGALGGPVLHKFHSIMPGPEKTLALGALTSGALGGAVGQRHLSPWVMEHLKALAEAEAEDVVDRKRRRRGEPKEASVMDLKKEAEMEKEAVIRTSAFDFGMEAYLTDLGMEKEAFAKACGVEPESLAERTIECLSSQLEEVPSESPAEGE